MTPQERDEKIAGILTKICINVLVKYLFDKNHKFVKQFDAYFDPKELLNYV